MFSEFELEAHLDCLYDSVQLFDGQEAAPELRLGQFCGSRVPDQPFVTSRNNMVMLFKSDASVQRKGFHATHTTGQCGFRTWFFI